MTSYVTSVIYMLYMLQKNNNRRWLLFFYSIPSRPVSSRMKIWRRLLKAGAVQIKGAVYVLPYSEENFELCQWFVSEVTSMGGEGAFVSVERVETMTDEEIIELFNQQLNRNYSIFEKRLEEFERKIDSLRKGTGIKDGKRLSGELNKYLREFEEIRRTDFFNSVKGEALKKRIEILKAKLKKLSYPDKGKTHPEVHLRRIEDYQRKIWVTRKGPFVDRMASAWLIKRFIDKEAVFDFIDEKDLKRLSGEAITFDIRGGEFTHVGDLCTFEVLLRSFNIKDRAVKKIAEIVHEIDIRDGKYRNPETIGIEELLRGIRKTAGDDRDALERGISLFEMLYASKT